MSQPVPKVTARDVERVVRREFSPADAPAAFVMLEEYGKKDGHRELARVRMAVLKLAGGSLERLKENLALADQDYRDVLSFAEYPRAFTEISPSEKDHAKRERVEQADWRQYCAWLAGKAPDHTHRH